MIFETLWEGARRLGTAGDATKMSKHFYIVKQDNEPEHKPICSIDGEPWPCQHSRVKSHRALVRQREVWCGACGQLRNAWTSLDIESAADGRPVYFHARKRCIVKAKQWWDENVLPYTGQPFLEGQWVGDLVRYIGLRSKLAEAPVITTA